jgi:hypothetical protein
MGSSWYSWALPGVFLGTNWHPEVFGREWICVQQYMSRLGRHSWDWNWEWGLGLVMVLELIGMTFWEIFGCCIYLTLLVLHCNQSFHVGEPLPL